MEDMLLEGNMMFPDEEINFVCCVNGMIQMENIRNREGGVDI